jgi:hypothetical protein
MPEADPRTRTEPSVQIHLQYAPLCGEGWRREKEGGWGGGGFIWLANNGEGDMLVNNGKGDMIDNNGMGMIWLVNNGEEIWLVNNGGRLGGRHTLFQKGKRMHADSLHPRWFICV